MRLWGPVSSTTQASVFGVSPTDKRFVFAFVGCTWTESISCTSRNFSNRGNRGGDRGDPSSANRSGKSVQENQHILSTQISTATRDARKSGGNNDSSKELRVMQYDPSIEVFTARLYPVKQLLVNETIYNEESGFRLTHSSS